jgi:anthranilate synthase/aminodeoxychorismate synthase-like glutamine amidotransferase
MTMRASVLLVDNYDSFTFNLAQAFGALGADVRVVRSDAIDVAGVIALAPSHVVISPGPGQPADAGASPEIVRAALEGAIDVPLLGVCLGHQCLGLVSGARDGPAKRLMHGRASTLTHDGAGLFAGLPSSLVVGRYHSLAIDAATIPASLVVQARTEDGEVMAMRHRARQVHGVQFHPESILTPDGPRLLANFLAL